MMKKEEKFSIERHGDFSVHSFSSFSLIYTPLMGTDAANLYQLLCGLQHEVKQPLINEVLMNFTNYSIDRIEKARKILEQFLLMKTYKNKEHDYIYVIYPPKSIREFLNHDVFGRLYLQKVGKDIYHLLKQAFIQKEIDKGNYEEISEVLQFSSLQDWSHQEEEVFEKTHQNALYDNNFKIIFDYKKFLTISEIVFPKNLRTSKNLESIGQIATVYGVSADKMKSLVGKSMDLQKQKLNFELLKRRAERVSEDFLKPIEDIYMLPPHRFMEIQQKGVPVSSSDHKLIDLLLDTYHLSPEVVNVLIEYTLEKTNQRFTKAYVEKVASNWVRLNIDTKEKALQQKSEEYHQEKPKSILQKEVVLPSWYDDKEEDDEDFDTDALLAKLQKL